MSGGAPASIDVLVVDDHPMFRLGVRTRLSAEPDIVVVGEAETGARALELVERTAPDVVLVDLNLPDTDGVELIRALGVVAPRAAPLVLTMLSADAVTAAVRAGARGYLLKDAEPGRIVAAVRAVAAGDSVFGPQTAARLLGSLDRTGPDRTAFPGLTERELEILGLLAEGLDNSTIGRRMGLRPKTVRNYVSNVIGKLQAADRAEAVLRARRAGLGDTGSDLRPTRSPIEPGR
ncbi:MULTISPECIES: response regulator [Pseudonocardia]|uniref:Transcriptional regulatory protein DegU n=2 Tax=Pseudonocardia TaxID=1847 RepID=A0A1Y2MK49_PSEAH|nr:MULTISPECIES: response regulator transcription factor [Pseudonocardia]OSY35451.1 Transcriptional regulatory protein DegU [Pseudonocardia autotrophica]TDN72202.1 LuxR family two component transcriptional regulator [Pseudonocardia autotrophica]BBG02909.1 DNA-binding response regulator [Pseudonocardia autotrophica]GEC27627.1 DNA-binding response regulator [Pseudonocardia saturnea]